MGSILCWCKRKQYDCPLHNAIFRGDSEKVEKILLRDPMVKFSNELGMLPLHHAVLIGSLDMVKSLLCKGANVDSTTEDGVTALHIACDKGFTGIVECMLNFGATVNDVCTSRQQNNGHYPLHLAVRNRNREILNLLLQHGADVDCIEADGKTPVHLAVERGYLEIVEDLLMCGARVKSSTSSNGEESLPIDERNLNEKTAIKCHSNEVTIGKKTLNEAYSDASINDSRVKIINDSSLLHIAVQNGEWEIATLLINHGARLDALDKESKTPMHYAVENGDWKLTKILLNFGFCLKDKLELLDASARKGNKEIVERLLMSDIDIEASDKIGRTALHFSVLYHNLGITEFLLRKGAAVNRKQADGTTALHIAAGNGSEHIVETLLEQGAQVHCLDERARTPLHLAAGGYGDYGRVAKILLEHGAQVDFRDRDGKTALHIASRKQHVQVVEELLERDADFNVVDVHGNTSIDCAFIDRFCIPKVFCVLAKYLDMAKASDLFVNEQSLDLVDSVSYLYDFYSKYDRKTFRKDCREEIERIKCERIIDGVSFYDFLTKDIDQIAAYTRNESLIAVLESRAHRKRYPIYASKLDNRLSIGKQRRDSMERGEKALDILVEITLPHLVVEKIFKYLDGSDIGCLIRASLNLASDCNSLSVMKNK